jgi:hypothetical protein
MVMSVLDRSHFEAVHRIARVSMHTKARAVYARLFSGLIEQSKASATTITTTTISSSSSSSEPALSQLQQTNALLQHTDFTWTEMKIPGSSPGAPSRAPGPNGMAACACTTNGGGLFSFLCMLVDAASVSACVCGALQCVCNT